MILILIKVNAYFFGGQYHREKYLTSNYQQLPKLSSSPEEKHGLQVEERIYVRNFLNFCFQTKTLEERKRGKNDTVKEGDSDKANIMALKKRNVTTKYPKNLYWQHQNVLVSAIL